MSEEIKEAIRIQSEKQAQILSLLEGLSVSSCELILSSVSNILKNNSVVKVATRN